MFVQENLEKKINLNSFLIGFISAVIISREIWVAALRVINSRNNQSDKTKVTFLAKAKTLNSIMEVSNAPKLVDLLSLDVEGAELEVLKGIDFSKFNFKYILVESRSVENLKNYLIPKNYELSQKYGEKDYLFKYLYF